MVVTDPIDDAAGAFYEHHGFTRLDGAQRMFITMKTIATLVATMRE